MMVPGTTRCSICERGVDHVSPNNSLVDVLLFNNAAVCPPFAEDSDMDPTSGSNATSSDMASFFSAAGKSLWCCSHPDRLAFCFCPVESVALCEECAAVGHTGHEVVAPAMMANLLSKLLVSTFDETIETMAELVGPVLSGVSETTHSAEYAVVRTKEAFVRLHELLNQQEALAMRSIASERKRRTKVLEAQAEELVVSLAQARVVTQAGRVALASGDTTAMGNAYRLAIQSRPLVGGPLFMKECPNIEFRVDTAAIQRALEEHVVVVGGDVAVRARACHAVAQDTTVTTLAVWRQLLETFNAANGAYPGSPMVTTAFCTAVTSLFAKAGWEQPWRGLVVPDLFDAMIAAVPSENSRDPQLWGAWCRVLDEILPSCPETGLPVKAVSSTAMT